MLVSVTATAATTSVTPPAQYQPLRSRDGTGGGLPGASRSMDVSDDGAAASVTAGVCHLPGVRLRHLREFPAHLRPPRPSSRIAPRVRARVALPGLLGCFPCVVRVVGRAGLEPATEG